MHYKVADTIYNLRGEEQVNFKKWTDDELTSTRDQIEVWCTRHAQSVWSGRKGYIIGLLGVFGISTGIVFLIFDGVEVISFVPILLGAIVCFTWWKTKQQDKKNSGFLGEVKEEIARRTKKVEKNKKFEKVDQVEKVKEPVAAGKTEEAETVEEAEKSGER